MIEVSRVRVPLTEAAIQLNFSGCASIDAARGHFQILHRSDFPQLFVHKAMIEVAPAMQPYQFTNSDRTRVVNIAINSFGFSMQTYPGWEEYKRQFLYYWQSIQHMIMPPLFTRIGMRYINQFPGRTDSAQPELKFEAPWLSALKERHLFHTGVIGYQVNQATAIINISSGNDESGGSKIVLDIDAQLTNVEATEIDSALSELHGIVEKYFFSSLENSLAAKLRPSLS